ncbi:MAG TPA: alpha/beta fold hydrolase [Vicinamibacterales bacterium]|nr:alpha/beta fold hydrolase [Vicinamibacterales bacterium]
MRAHGITRRRFAALIGGAIASSACSGSGGCYVALPAATSDGRLKARPVAGVKTTAQGTAALGLGSARDAVLQMPSKAGSGPFPLLVLLHGAGGSGERFLRRLSAAGDAAGVALLAPDSRGTTWDAIRGDFDQDVMFLNRALEKVFQMVAVDPTRLAVGGFSDGASYAVSLGLVNGDLFNRVVAFSPGFLVDSTPYGKPRFYVSHGTADPILPINRCGRVVVRLLRTRGYDVTFHEFNGEHEIPNEIATEGMSWVSK